MTPEREKKFRKVLSNRQSDLTVVFENVHDPHNISACLRTCDAVGVSEVFIIHTSEQRFSKLGKKSSSSASKWMDTHVFFSVEDCFDEVRRRYKKIFSTKLTVESKSIYDLNLSESVALVFGNEHEGVSAKAASLSDGNFLIPQVGMIESLNISVACAVSLYESLRQRMAAGKYDQSSLSETELELKLKKWEGFGLRNS
mgnify:CR=1 FL=1